MSTNPTRSMKLNPIGSSKLNPKFLETCGFIEAVFQINETLTTPETEKKT